MSLAHMGMQMRVACSTLIYRKALKLSNTALGETTIGQMVNLLSNDVNRFDSAIIFLHHILIGPLQTVIISYLLYIKLGLPALIGVVMMLSFVPLQSKLLLHINNFIPKLFETHITNTTIREFSF